MAERTATAHWEGSAKAGSGHIAAESGAVAADYSFGARFGDDKGTNPEELLGAAHAGCFTMALAVALTNAEHPPTRLDTTARVTIEKSGDGFRITHIKLSVDADVADLDPSEFDRLAEGAKAGCPVSKALAGTEITLESKLNS